ncbi:hypothetical protein ANRL3_01871 [Anaerolineae bacterium]|nr:hypothetical protein ANRL3_01871 [Anaerolineae bacterium]
MSKRKVTRALAAFIQTIVLLTILGVSVLIALALNQGG